MNDWAAGKLHAARSLAQFIRAFKNWREVWSAYRAGLPLPPLVLGKDLTLFHGPGDDPIFLFREIFLDECYVSGGFYRPRAGDTVLDLGANIGSFALFLQWKARGVLVHSFEPAASTFARLVKNVSANGLDGIVTPHRLAVFNAPGEVRIKHSGDSIRNSVFDSADVDSGDEETVPCVDLAGAVALTGAETIDLLKVDVEGAEIEVVEGGGANVWGRIRRVTVEYHDTFRPGSSERVANALRGYGFANVAVLPSPHDPALGFVRAGRV